MEVLPVMLQEIIKLFDRKQKIKVNKIGETKKKKRKEEKRIKTIELMKIQ